MKTVDSLRPTKMIKDGVSYHISYEISQDTLNYLSNLRKKRPLSGWRLYTFEVAVIIGIFLLLELAGQAL